MCTELHITLTSPSVPQETTLYDCTVRINEPVGVIGIACPDESPLLAFVSLFGSAVVKGNTIIIVPSEKYLLTSIRWREEWGMYETCLFTVYLE